MAKTTLKVDVRISLVSWKKGVSKINTNILKYLKDLRTFSMGVDAERKSLKELHMIA